MEGTVVVSDHYLVDVSFVLCVVFPFLVGESGMV